MCKTKRINCLQKLKPTRFLLFVYENLSLVILQGTNLKWVLWRTAWNSSKQTMDTIKALVSGTGLRAAISGACVWLFKVTDERCPFYFSFGQGLYEQLRWHRHSYRKSAEWLFDIFYSSIVTLWIEVATLIHSILARGVMGVQWPFLRL